MGSMTIRNLEDELKQALRVRAAREGVSMEAEAREILKVVIENNISLDSLVEQKPRESAWDVIKRLREKYGTGDFEIPPRTEMAGSRRVFEE